ncbi:MAG: hypothetical protein IPL26_01100 [Leptospiraceae bacterium]|nr:hypothetical protein [Leptospiraceae bacterium]
MAKLQSGVLENFSGSIGDLNFYKWKNKLVIRSKRTPTKKPPTEAQLLAREKFRVLGGLYRKVKLISQIGFKSFTSSMTYKNAFFKYNHSAISKTETGLIINYPGLVLSNGILRGIQVVSARSSEGIFSLHWKNQYDLSGEEKVYLALLPTQENYSAIYSEISCLREKIELEIPSDWNSSQFYAYTFIVNKKEDVSNSQYLGEFFVSVI